MKLNKTFDFSLNVCLKLIFSFLFLIYFYLICKEAFSDLLICEVTSCPWLPSARPTLFGSPLYCTGSAGGTPSLSFQMLVVPLLPRWWCL